MTISVSAFHDKTVLVVEDDPLIAMALADRLEDAGATVLGPVSSVADALRILASEVVDGALLDINLIGEQSYPVAEAMAASGQPYVFVSSLTRAQTPEAYRDRLIDKTASLERVGDMLFQAA